VSDLKFAFQAEHKALERLNHIERFADGRVLGRKGIVARTADRAGTHDHLVLKDGSRPPLAFRYVVAIKRTIRLEEATRPERLHDDVEGEHVGIDAMALVAWGCCLEFGNGVGHGRVGGEPAGKVSQKEGH
jgi:hypothetical protein